MSVGSAARLGMAVALCAALAGAAPQARAQTPTVAPLSDPAQGGPPLGWGWSLSANVVQQLESELDEAGSFDATRAGLDVGVRHAFSEGTSAGLSLGYGYDHYGFSADARIGARAPWDRVHTLRAALPLFWRPAPDWQVLAIPRVRWTAEEPGDWGDGFTGGVILGVAYRVSDRLEIGPGVGVTTELEEGVEVFPILVVDWQVTDRLRIETGRSLGATRGPGLLASFSITDTWTASLGFRREELRFRLADGGVGEDSSFPVVAGITWGPPWAEVSLFVGAELGGELRIEDERGDTLGRSDYDPAAIVGLNVRLRL